MSTAVRMKRIAEESPHVKARIAYVYYLLTIVTGIVIFSAGGSLGFVVDVVGSALYVVATVVFYVLTRRA
ncbi:MAG TPA: hypothetical protein VFI95_03845 [Terriglobales bacterium]|nr:hypothetical protein [Terriglobales bacterium]